MRLNGNLLLDDDLTLTGDLTSPSGTVNLLGDALITGLPSTARLGMIDPSQAVDAKAWRIICGNTLRFLAMNDALTAPLMQVLTLNRSGAVSMASTLALGATPAASGAVRLGNTSAVVSRNAANTADVNIANVDPANVTVLGGTVGVYAPGGLTTTPLNADSLTSGAVADARLSVNVLKHTGGYPGGTTTYLRADGSFTAPPGGGGSIMPLMEDLVFGITPGTVRVNTADGADSNYLVFCGGGGVGVTRGASLYITGNENPNPGQFVLYMGDVPAAKFVVRDATTEFLTVRRDGTVLASRVRPVVALLTPGDTTYARIHSAVPGGRMDITTNLYYDGANWMKDDPAKTAGLVTLFESGQFGVWSIAGGTNPATITPTFIVDNVGATTCYSAVTVNGPDNTPLLKIGGDGAGFPALRHVGTGLEVVRADNAIHVAVKAASFYAVYGGNSFADFTCRGTTDLQSTVSVAGEVNALGGSGTGYSTAPIEVMTTATPRVAFHWPGVVASQIGMDSAGVIRTYDNPGTGYAAFAAAATTLYGRLTVNSDILTTLPIYPGRVDTGWTSQGSWYLASHGAYGLYANTGLYLNGGFWVTGASNLGALNVGGVTTLSQYMNMNGTWLYNTDLRWYTQRRIDVYRDGGNTLTLNFEQANCYTHSASYHMNISIINLPGANKKAAVELWILQDGNAWVVNLPWPFRGQVNAGGNPGSVTIGTSAGYYTVLTFHCWDNAGAGYFVTVAGKNW